MLDSAKFSRLSADDEEAYATISINVATVGFVGIFIPSLLLTAVALLNVNDKIEPWEGNNDTLTQTLLENIEMLRNGSYYYYHKDEQTGIIDATVIDSWYSNIFEGKYRYDFGYSFNNFCWVSIGLSGRTSFYVNQVLLFDDSFSQASRSRYT
uniref:DUF5683 domain-containing protein n=1 Tax=Haemonchus contortus TaxID=6289 RepID=A0A7I4Z103_HAECO